jgi:hypothetical protein
MSDLSFLYGDGFDTDKAAEEAGGGGDFSPIPKGTYRVKVVQADTKPTKAGNGSMLKVRLDVLGPQHAGRVVFDDILVKHTSEDAQRIGRERFATLCRAAGIANPKDTSVLVGKEVDAFIKVETDAQYGDRNRVSFYSPAESGVSFSGSSSAVAFTDDDVPF